MIRPYVAGAPALWAAIGLALGVPADRVATVRQRSFLPMELMSLFDGTSVAGRPLVSSRDTLFWIPGAGRAPRAFPWPTVLGWLLLAAGLLATLVVRETRYLRAFDVTLLALAGAAGVVIALLWFATEHGVTGPNMHLLWAWPTHLAAAVALARGRPWRLYLLAGGVAAVVVAAGWAFWPQGMPAALLPVVLLLGVRCLVRGRAARTQPRAAASTS
jgi:hypothetical protein